jgi:hypothetical protein
MPTSFTTLEQVARWALARGASIDVVTQDEYTHDVVVVDGVDVWVFDST